MPQDLDELARQVRDAFHAGRCSMLDLASEDPAEPFQGAESQCHANAEAWCSRHPGFTVEEGYLAAGVGCYAPHSVVRSNTGRLLDVTLPAGSSEGLRRFVRHADVSAEPFRRLASVSLPVTEWVDELNSEPWLPCVAAWGVNRL